MTGADAMASSLAGRAARTLGVLGALLGGCAMIDSWTGTWHAAGDGPIAHVAIETPKGGQGELHFCAEDGWRTVDDADTTVPAGRMLKMKVVAQRAPHIRHGVEHPERECIDNLQFRPEPEANYRIVWNRQASNCAVIVFRKVAGGGEPPDDWSYESSLERSDGRC
jgi:hypothetical protein